MYRGGSRNHWYLGKRQLYSGCPLLRGVWWSSHCNYVSFGICTLFSSFDAPEMAKVDSNVT